MNKQKLLAALYLLGFIVVMTGALFKLQGYPAADWLLGIGLGMEGIAIPASIYLLMQKRKAPKP